MRSSCDLHNYLVEQGVPHEIVHLSGLSMTAAQAAEQLGVGVAEVIKSLVFLVDGRPCMVLVPGDATVATDLLARELAGRHVELARGSRVLELTGYRLGAVPPCALETTLPVVADPDAFAPAVVYCGGGTTSTMLKVRSADLKALVDPQLASVGERS